MLVVRYSVLASSMSIELGSRLSGTRRDRRQSSIFGAHDGLIADRVHDGISDRHCFARRTSGCVGRHHYCGRARVTLNRRSGWDIGAISALPTSAEVNPAVADVNMEEPLTRTPSDTAAR